MKCLLEFRRPGASPRLMERLGLLSITQAPLDFHTEGSIGAKEGGADFEDTIMGGAPCIGQEGS